MMAIYKIARVYKIPASSKREAVDRMMEAVFHGVETDYHAYDVIRTPEDEPGTAKRISLRPPQGWLAILVDQLFGQSETKSKR